MLKKLFIRPYFGVLPEWMEQYNKNIIGLKPDGFDWWIITDKEFYSDLIQKKLGIKPNFDYDACKSSEFGPAFGIIFEDYLKGYDFWGYTNLDVVYGNLKKFIPDTFLTCTDVFSDDPRDMCGPFSLCRNNKLVNNLFKEHPNWKQIFEDKKHNAFDEKGFTDIVRKASQDGKIRLNFARWHGEDTNNKIVCQKNLSVFADGKEVMFYHFKEKKIWPLN